MSRSLFTAALLASTTLVAPAMAGEFSWTASSTNNWGTGGNWSVISGSDAAPPNRNSDIAKFTDSGAFGSADLNSQSFTVNALVLDRAATFTISNGTLAFGGTTPTIDVAAGNVLNFANVTTTGDIVKDGAGAIIVDEHTGDIFVTDGTLQIGKAPGSSFPAGIVTGRVDLTGGATLEVYTFATDSVGALTGSGGTEFINTATLTLTGSSGTFQYDGQITDNGGVGTLSKTGGSTQVLTNAANTYSGGTSITGGTISIAADGALGAVGGGVTLDGGALQAAATLTSNRSVTLMGAGTFDAVAGATLTLGGTIGGGGSLTKTGDGTLALTGTVSYGGSTTVTGGTLLVNTNITSSSGVLVGPGGILGGGGTMGQVTVNGTVAPGNSIGTINTGDITFDPGSTLRVEVDPAGQADLVNVTGTATITGGTVAVDAAAGSYAPSVTYTIVTASVARTGTFGAVTTASAFLTPSLSYDPTHVFLTMAPVTTPDGTPAGFDSVAQTTNQAETARGLQSTGGGALFNAILGMDAATARAAFDQLSGEAQASFLSFLAQQSVEVRNAVLGRLGQAARTPGGGAVMALVDTGTTGLDLSGGSSAIWGGLRGGYSAFAATGNAAGSFGGSGGLIAGLDGMLGDWRLGGMIDLGMSSFSVPARNATAQSTDIGGGVYAGTDVAGTGIRLGASYVAHRVTSTRTVTIPAPQTLTATFAASTMQAFGEINHGFDLGAVTLTPFGQLAVIGNGRDAFTETGGPAALSSAAAWTTTTLASAGLRGSVDIAVGEALVTATGEVGYRHAFAADPAAVNTFAGGTAFTVTGTPVAADSLVLGASVGIDLNARARLDLTYNGEIAAGSQSHAATATATVKF